jgi:universal stress protein E
MYDVGRGPAWPERVTATDAYLPHGAGVVKVENTDTTWRGAPHSIRPQQAIGSNRAQSGDARAGHAAQGPGAGDDQTTGSSKESPMSSIRNILVSVTDDSDAPYILEKAQRLAAATSARIHVVRVIYEGIADLSAAAIDASVDLKASLLQAAEAYLEELVEPARRKMPGLETVTLWNPRGWEGVLHAAERVEADLILKGATVREGFGSAIRTPDDWNLLRHATVPVLLVKPDAWVAEPVVLCALDAFDDAHRDMNLEILRQARRLATLLHGPLDVAVAYPLFEPWVGELGALRSYDELRQSIEGEIRDRVVALAGAAGVEYRRLVADEGHAVQVIGRLVEDDEAQIVVIGTHARAGVQGVLLGNTSERVLHVVPVDVATVPGPARTGGK